MARPQDYLQRIESAGYRVTGARESIGDGRDGPLTVTAENVVTGDRYTATSQTANWRRFNYWRRRLESDWAVIGLDHGRSGRYGHGRHGRGRDSIDYAKHSTAYHRPELLIITAFNSLLVYTIESQGQRHERSPEIYSGVD